MSTVVAWTGHRPDLFRVPTAARESVETAAQALVTQDSTVHFLVGGQRGVDTWAAQTAITLGIPFTLLLPLAPTEFAADWALEDRQVLDVLIAQAEVVRVFGGEPAAAYTERNRQLATQAELLIAVWTQRGGGGTAETIALARAAGTPVREIVLPAAHLPEPPSGRGI